MDPAIPAVLPGPGTANTPALPEPVQPPKMSSEFFMVQLNWLSLSLCNPHKKWVVHFWWRN